MRKTMRQFFMGLFVPAALAIVLTPTLFTSEFASAVERTGEILRELLQSMEKDFDTLEKETRNFAKQSGGLNKQLEEKARLFNRTDDLVRKEAINADILYLEAQLNELDRREVESAITMVEQVRGKLHRIREVIKRGGVLPPPEELPQVRQKLGKLLSTAAGFLDKWEKSSPDKKGEIAALKSSLLGTLSNWESPSAGLGSSQDELNRTVRAFDAAYGQFLAMSRTLEQERQYLEIKSYAATARLTLLRLNGGKINIGSVLDSVESKRKGIDRRREILRGTDGAGPLGGDGNGTLGSEQEEAFQRMKRGEFRWQKGGTQ